MTVPAPSTLGSKGAKSLSASDRTWALPSRPYSVRMTWHDLLFMHWPVDEDSLRRHIHKRLTIDTFDGCAWIGIVPFRMSNVTTRCFPALPGVSAFPELNVRTYVTIDEKPGVWFFTLDAASRLAVWTARKFFYLNYLNSHFSVAIRGGSVDYCCKRTHRGAPPARLKVQYRAHGGPFASNAGTLEHWLTARYCLYTADRNANLLRGEIDHAPWSLRQAEVDIRENTMTTALGVDTSGHPHLLWGDRLEVRAWQNAKA